MTTFSGIDIANTGLGFNKYWLDTVAHNLANLNTVLPGDQEPFRARVVIAQQLGDQPFAETGSGVAVGAVLEQEGDPALVYAPEHPLADEDGYVVRPLVDLAAQMTDMMIAQRSYQTNARSMQSSKEAYEAALQIGQR
ncbi:MAG: flagellar basal body rod protein FlgC [Nitriliruptor sp.]|uniref:flagellar basal body rod protein FlgC n=1 Tax=Nitriliruptor sp. TaxID=2448056 RepID=UPI0034A086CA